MAINEPEQKEYWTTNKTIEGLHYDLISTKGEDGLRKYEEMARYLLYKIPIWRSTKTGDHQPPAFIIELNDISEKVREKLVNVSDISLSRAIVIEGVSKLFENLGPKERVF
jgi:hypothetical protein